MTVIPDSIEPVIGWRSWNVDDHGFLRSQHNSLVWTPGARVEASCSPGPGSMMTFPPPGCYVWRPHHHEGIPTAEAQRHTDEVRQQAIGGGFSPRIMNGPSVELPNGMGWVLELEPPPEDSTSQHEPPHERCTCGIYAVSDLTEALHGEMVGRVALWGKVVPGTKGWRGQFAYPVELFVSVAKKRFGKTTVVIPDTLLQYGVPIRSTREIELPMVAA